MLRLLCLLSGLIFGASLTYAQTVINTEELRLDLKEKQVVGLVDADFGMTRNKAGFSLRPSLDLRGELLSGPDRYILLGGYRLSRFTNINVPGSDAINFTNRGFGHLRYNRQLRERLTWEAFAQLQFDEIQEIDLRQLLGSGPRYQLARADSAFLYAGMLYMYEYEETSAEAEHIRYNRHHRLSTYLSAGFTFGANAGLNLILYYQPRLDRWNDYRVSGVMDFTTPVFENFFFNLSLDLVYDTRPPVTVPEEMYDLTAGIKWTW